MGSVGGLITGALARAGESGTQILAHRGFHDGSRVAENSLGAFRRAIDVGVEALELDVRRTLDNVLVVHHDPITSGAHRISRTRYADLPLLVDHQRIPRLDEVIDLVAGTPTRMSVELKAGGYEQAAVDALRQRLPAEQFDVISFGSQTVRRVEDLGHPVRTGSLSPRIMGWMRESALYPAAITLMDRAGWHPALNKATRIGADFVSVDHRMASPTFLADAARRGIPVDVWTVNEQAEMERLLTAGVHGIVTDHPDVAIGVRARLAALHDVALPHVSRSA